MCPIRKKSALALVPSGVPGFVTYAIISGLKTEPEYPSANRPWNPVFSSRLSFTSLLRKKRPPLPETFGNASSVAPPDF